MFIAFGELALIACVCVCVCVGPFLHLDFTMAEMAERSMWKMALAAKRGTQLVVTRGRAICGAFSRQQLLLLSQGQSSRTAINSNKHFN